MKKRICSLEWGIRNVSPNEVFSNEVYGSDSDGFGVNPLSNEFRFCNSDEWRSRNHGGIVGIHRYGGCDAMVVVKQNQVLGDGEIVNREDAKENKSDEDDKFVNFGWSDYQNETVE
ncbi:hypothetical protein Tco_0417418 [Tanacetum coccineum]